MAKSSHRVRVHAAPDKVYQALTTKSGLQGWFTSGVEGDVREGQPITMHFSGKEPFRWHLARFEPTARVHWECLAGPGSAKGTAVTYVLKGEGQGQTVIECDHDGWPEGHDALATCNTLWGMLMHRLKAFSETGQPDPAFTHDGR